MVKNISITKYALLFSIFTISFLASCSALNNLFKPAPSERQSLRVGVNNALFISVDFSNNLVSTQDIGASADYKSARRTNPYIAFNGWKDEFGVLFEQLITPNLSASSTVNIQDLVYLIFLEGNQDVYIIRTLENHFVKVYFTIQNPQLVHAYSEMNTNDINTEEYYLMVWAYNPNGELYFQEKQIELFKDGVSLGVTENTNIAECVQYILEKYQ